LAFWNFSLPSWNFSPTLSLNTNQQSYYIYNHKSLSLLTIKSFFASSSSPAQSLLMSSLYMVTHPSILLIEDSPGECELFRLALAQTGLDVTLYTEHDAKAAFHFLQDRFSYDSKRSPQYSPGEAAGVVSTARVERAPSERARSASTETDPTISQIPSYCHPVTSYPFSCKHRFTKFV